MKEEETVADVHTTTANSSSSIAVDASAQTSAGEAYLGAMNSSFAKCLSLVCPPIQYPPHCRINPVQQDAADTAELETRLEEFFLHAKQLELLFLNDIGTEQEKAVAIGDDHAINGDVQQSDLEMEILNLEAELTEKNDLIEKYMDVIRGWEGKFKRLENRMSPDKDEY